MAVPESKTTKPYRHFNWVSEAGRTRCEIECPFCGEVVTAYLWSLAGKGKRCPKCKALHGYHGFTEAPNTDFNLTPSTESQVKS